TCRRQGSGRCSRPQPFGNSWSVQRTYAVPTDELPTYWGRVSRSRRLRKEDIVDTAQPPYSSTASPPRQDTRPRNGLGVAALVIGVGSLVAVASLLLFPLALTGGLVGPVL